MRLEDAPLSQFHRLSIVEQWRGLKLAAWYGLLLGGLFLWDVTMLAAAIAIRPVPR